MFTSSMCQNLTYMIMARSDYSGSFSINGIQIRYNSVSKYSYMFIMSLTHAMSRWKPLAKGTMDSIIRSSETVQEV